MLLLMMSVVCKADDCAWLCVSLYGLRVPGIWVVCLVSQKFEPTFNSAASLN